MLPNFDQNFQMTQTYRNGTWIECLFCYQHFPPKTIFKDKVNVEILSDLFNTFSKYMKWESPAKDQFDFMKEQFPFCSFCSNNLVRVFKLDEQIQNIISDVISKIVNGAETVSKNERDGASVRIDFYRRQTIFQHQPSVIQTQVEDVEPAELEKEPCTTGAPILITEDDDLVPPSPCQNSSPSRLSTTVPAIAKFSDPFWTLGRQKVIHDNKYLFSCYDNTWHCSTCDQSYINNRDLELHWETTPCGRPQQPVEIIETHPGHNDTVSETSVNDQQPDEFRRNAISNPSLRNHPNPENQDRPNFVCPDPSEQVPQNEHKCKFCHQSFPIKWRLTKHLLNCGTGAASSVPTDRVQNESVVEGKLPCNLCNKMFNNRSRLTYHALQYHTPEKDKAFQCSVCNRKFASKGLLRSHFSQHEKVECEICNNLYSVLSISTHKYSQHKSVDCDLCNKSYKVDSFLEHVKWHKDQDPTGRAPALNQFRRLHQKARPSFKCNICGTVFKRNEYLKRHTFRFHTDESCKTIACQTCGRKFAAECLLKRHMLSHRKVPCTVCGGIYNAAKITAHKKLHEGRVSRTAPTEKLSPKDCKLWKCKFCSQSFQIKWGLTKHLQSCGQK